MNNSIIEVHGIGKKYNIGEFLAKNSTDTMRDKIALSLRNTSKHLFHRKSTMLGSESFWAVKDISFDVKKGEVLGIIGRNGAGKSTLLKILCKITSPTEGKAIIRGRVGSLLEVGTGFHQELTGRENIFFSGAILGMKNSEIVRKLDEIIDFSGIEQFIDTPVKRYSSGMRVRLGFAVAAHLEPEILLIDEVLAVGDADFQRKCLNKMSDSAHGGRTILFVSHNMVAVQNLCTRAILMERGKIAARGTPIEVISRYLNNSVNLVEKTPLNMRTDRSGSGQLRFSSARVSSNANSTTTIQTGQDIQLVFSMKGTNPGRMPAVFRFEFTNQQGQSLFACLSRSSSLDVLRPESNCTVICKIPRFPLLPGKYFVSAWCKIGDMMADNIKEAAIITVEGGDCFRTGKLQLKDGGDMLVSHSWELAHE